MYTKIFVPLDGSKTAEAVLPYVEALAVGFHSAVELVSVIDIGAMAAHLPGDRVHHLEELMAAAEKTSTEYLEKIARTMTRYPVARRIIRGHPGEAILETANQDSNTLIAMATHGRSGTDRWLLGSVAEKVLRGSTNPLLLVRAAVAKRNPQQIIDSFIVPLDGSSVAEEILPVVSSWAQSLALEVMLIRAVGAPESPGALDDYPDYEAIREEARHEASAYLKTKEAELVREGVRTVSTVTLEGAAADEIIAYAESAPSAIVAMSTHGRSGISRWIMGSVTEKVARHGRDPVLIVRAGKSDS